MLAVDHGRDFVHNESGEAETKTKGSGKLFFSAASRLDPPVIGNGVMVHSSDAETFAIIHAALARKALVARKTAAKRN